MIRLLAFSLCMVLPIGDASAAEDCNVKQIASLPMINRDPDAVIVSADLAGSAHPFLVDTGGAQSELYGDVVEKLGLTTLPMPTTVEIYDMHGHVARRYLKVPQFSLGRVRGDNWIMIVATRDSGDTSFDGILSPDILQNFDLDFDFAAQKLNLMSPEHCEGKVVYWAQDYADAPFTKMEGHIVLPMTLDGQEVQAILDTGAMASGISEKLAGRLFKIDRSSPGVEADPKVADDSLMRYRHRFKSLSIAGLAVNNPLLYLIPDLAQESFEKRHQDKLDFDPVYQSHLNTAQVLLGMNILSKLHLYVAYRERKLYLTTATAH